MYHGGPMKNQYGNHFSDQRNHFSDARTQISDVRSQMWQPNQQQMVHQQQMVPQQRFVHQQNDYMVGCIELFYYLNFKMYFEDFILLNSFFLLEFCF